MIKSALGRLSGIVFLRVFSAGSERGTLSEEFEILVEAADVSDINDGQPASLKPYPRIRQIPGEYDRRSDTDILKNCAVLLVSTCEQSDRYVTAWLDELGAEVATTTDPNLALDAIVENPAAWGLLVVVMDQMMDEEAVVESLLLARAVKPDLPVILASRYYYPNEYSVERTVICDVSLPAPLRKTSFELAVYAALENNRPLSRL